MRLIIGFIAILGLVLGCAPAQKEIKVTEYVLETRTVDGFDSIRAMQDGADQYGMRQYVMAFLYAGPNRSQDDSTRMDLQRKHLDNINRLAEEGYLAVAGPFLDDGDLKGIYLFNVTTVEEARELTGTDPAVKAGSLVMELHPWYGSAALFEVNEIHKKIAKVYI